MRAALNAHVDTVRHEMFLDSCNGVRAKLEAMIGHVEELMANKADELFVSISRDYRSVFGSNHAPQGDMMPRWQRSMRQEIKAVIGRANKIFKQAAGIEVEDDDEGSDADVEQDGDFSEGENTDDREAGASTFGDHHNVKMEGNEEDYTHDSSPEDGDFADNQPTELKQTVGGEDVEMANTESKKPRTASYPRDSGVGIASSECMSEPEEWPETDSDSES